MTLQVSYMGTKREIAPLVARLAATAPDGPLLDLFSGICTVGSAVGSVRPIWCNDTQHFASTLADAFLRSDAPPLSFQVAADLAYPHYLANKQILYARFATELAAEHRALQSPDARAIARFQNQLPNVTDSLSLEVERRALAQDPQLFPYRLFSITFSGGYVGLSQAIQIDSIRYALDVLRDVGHLDSEQHRWASIALCQALCKISTTTGHFAQFLHVNERNQLRFFAKRRRCVWSQWLSALDSFVPLGSSKWRQQNNVFRQDAASLLSLLKRQKLRPAVIYADPPYTKDQYSRYYHLYETLLLYDYPCALGKARARPDRFTSRFCLRSTVHQAFNELIALCASLRSVLIITYPTRGLLPTSLTAIPRMLDRYFGSSRVEYRLNRLHSSLGGSKGKEKSPAEEVIYLAG